VNNLKDEQKKYEFEKNLSSFFKENNSNIQSYSDDEKESILSASYDLYLSIEKLWSSSKSPIRPFEQRYQSIKHYRNSDNFIKTIFLQHYFESDQVSDWSYESLNTFLSEFTEAYQSWETEVYSNHTHCQEFIENIDTLSIAKDNLICPCNQCLADFRTRIRDMLFKECIAEIEKLKTWLNLRIVKKILKKRLSPVVIN